MYIFLMIGTLVLSGLLIISYCITGVRIKRVIRNQHPYVGKDFLLTGLLYYLLLFSPMTWLGVSRNSDADLSYSVVLIWFMALLSIVVFILIWLIYTLIVTTGGDRSYCIAPLGAFLLAVAVIALLILLGDRLDVITHKLIDLTGYSYPAHYDYFMRNKMI